MYVSTRRTAASSWKAPATTATDRQRSGWGGGCRRSPRPLSSNAHRTLTYRGDNALVRALVVEDELKMAALIRRGLTEEGYAADVARTGDDAVWMARATPYDVIVLDVMLPGRDGLAVCRELRESGVWAPVLMLTARDSIED